MTENAKDELVRIVYEHQSDIPLENKRLNRRYSMEQIANFPDDVLSRYYYMILENLKHSAELKKERQEKVFLEPTIEDKDVFYLIDSNNELENRNLKNSDDVARQNYGNRDGFLGPEGPNPLDRILKKY